MTGALTRRPRAGSGGARGGSPFWGVVFRVFYRILRLLDPLIRQWWRGYGLGNACELRVAGRATGRQRTFLLGLLRADGSWYLGHPNGDAAWTRNLEAAYTTMWERYQRGLGPASFAVSDALPP